VPRLAEQGDGAVPDQVDGRLEACHEQEQRRADELGGAEPVAVLLDRHQGGKQAVVRIGAALGHQVPQVSGQGQLRRARLALGGQGGGLGVEGSDEGVTPGPEAGLVLSRDAEQVADHRDGQREGQRVDEVEACRGVGVGSGEEPAGHLADPRLQAGYRLRGEGTGHQAPDAGVVGRVHGEQVGGGKLGAGIAGRVSGRLVTALVHRGGAEPPVPQDALRHRVVRRHPGTERAADERTPADVGVQRVGVGRRLRSHPPGEGIAAPLVEADHRGLRTAHQLFCEAHLRPPRVMAAGRRVSYTDGIWRTAEYQWAARCGSIGP
jgi:hypothetical protein